MKQMKNKQQGISVIGIVFMILILAFFVLFGLRLFPLYNEKFTVISTMDNIATKPGAENFSGNEARKYFIKSMEIANITRFDGKVAKEYIQVKKDKKKKKAFLHVTYEASNVFFKDIKLLLAFDRKVELGGDPGDE